MIHLILKTIIPAEPETGMPSAAEVNFEAYAKRFNIQPLVVKYATYVETLAKEKTQQSFDALDEGTRLAVLNTSRISNIRLFSEFLTHVFRAYYSNQNVQELIGAGSVPPYPNGNTLADQDWSLLEPVYLRGNIYRDLPESLL